MREESENASVGELLLAAYDGFYEADVRAQDFGTGERLHHSEIHLLQAVADAPGASVTAVARELGITRGAVSQTLARLEEKGMVQPEGARVRGASRQLALTRLGQVAVRNHRAHHASYDLLAESLLCDANDHERAFLVGFLARLVRTLAEEGRCAKSDVRAVVTCAERGALNASSQR